MAFDTWYIYFHRCPVTKELLYIGIGETDRAWLFKANHRSTEHKKYLYNLRKEGYLPSDWVQIHSKFHSRAEARKLEKELILKLNPKFNIHRGLGSMANLSRQKEARKLREEGLSYKQIAAKMGIYPASVWRYVNYYVV